MWYKKSQKMFDKDDAFKIDDFEDRNLINEQIRSLDDFSSMLSYCSRLVFQTQRGAKGVVSQIINNKKMSSFPSVIMLLVEAEKVAMDSPPKFSEFCVSASIELQKRIDKLKNLRKEFSQTKNKVNKLQPKKGLF